jgi:hypothetical protein
MYSQSIDEFVQSIYKWTEFTPQLEQIFGFVMGTGRNEHNGCWDGFTTGRANITVAMTEENQAHAYIEASWNFADKDQGLGGDLKTTMRGYIRCCSFHW